MTDQTLSGKVAIVTGATSGIGAAVARRFARSGAVVVISGRNQLAAEDLADELRAAGCEVGIELGDVADSNVCAELISSTVESFGGLDILANVAGVITRGSAVETTDDEWALNIAVNAGSVFYSSRAAIPHMKRRGGGVIANLASNVGLVGSPGLAAYCASKGAVVTLTKAMALDHAIDNIRVNAVCPGAVDTPMIYSGHHKTGLGADEITSNNVGAIPLGVIATPAEVADAVHFLCSDAAGHITGVALPVDGGYLAG